MTPLRLSWDSSDSDSPATLLVTPVIKHLHDASEVAKPDQLFTTPNRNLRLFVLGESDSWVEDLLLHAEHQEELNWSENGCG